MKVIVPYALDHKLKPYAQALWLAGIEPVPVKPGTAINIRTASGLVLTGGTDVDPGLYGETLQPNTQQPDRERDAYECALVREALDHDIPVLAICRGMQLLNVVLGGTLFQHIEGHHNVRHALAENSWTAIRGLREVNSRHHQAVREIGDGLVVTARAHDGTIEAVEMPGRRYVSAVQWHPEDMVGEPEQLQIFEGFRRNLL